MDETLDVLAAHGVAGFTGILFIGFFAQASWNGVSDGWVYGNVDQLGDQALAALAAPLYAFGATFLLLKAMALVMPLRVSEREEALGLDVTQHGEEAYATGEGAILVTPEAGLRRTGAGRASRPEHAVTERRASDSRFSRVGQAEMLRSEGTRREVSLGTQHRRLHRHGQPVAPGAL